MRRFLFLTASARVQGNSERLARQAAHGLPEGVAVEWFNLHAPALPAFEDLRPAVIPVPKGRLAALLQAVERASDLVLVSPVYWYAFPAPVHLMLAHFSAFADRPDLHFIDHLRGKGLWLITARADPDPSVPDLAEAMLRRTGDWLGMNWRGALHGVGDGPGSIEEDAVWPAASGFLT